MKNLDQYFLKGMKKDAKDLKDPAKKQKDPYIPDWSEDFLKDSIDGLIWVAGSGKDFLEARLDKITATEFEGSLKGSIKVHKVLFGKQRDKKGEEKHEQYVAELDAV